MLLGEDQARKTGSDSLLALVQSESSQGPREQEASSSFERRGIQGQAHL